MRRRAVGQTTTSIGEQRGQRHKDRDHVREEGMSWQPTDRIKHRDFPSNSDIHYLPPFAF